MVTFARKILKDSDLAEDAVQEAQWELLQYLPRIRDNRAVGAIARRMVFKACDRLIRKRKELVSAELEIPFEGPQALQEFRMELEDFQSSLNDPLDEKIFRLRFLQDHTVAGVAEQLGQTVPKTRYRIRQLEQMLRIRLSGKGYRPGSLEMAA